jgi:hypothetical protein
LTPLGGGDREDAIEWRTYTPDGRVLTVRDSDAGWIAECEGNEATRDSLVQAIRDAVVGPALPLHRDETLDAWIRETAAHIVGDTMH